MGRKVYVAFDYDDADVKAELVRQGGLPECPFQLEDCSIAKKVEQDWPKVAEQRIREAGCVIVLCGEQSHQAGGASTEVQIAQRIGVRSFCLAATRKGTPTPPRHVPTGTPIYTWRWPTVKTLVEGGTPPPDAVVRLA